MLKILEQINDSTVKLFIIAAAPLTMWGLSHSQINDYLQTASLLVGILVGLLGVAAFIHKAWKNLFGRKYRIKKKDEE